jgi:hypothetical protein
MGHGAGLRHIAVVRGAQQTQAAPDARDFPGFGYLLGQPQRWQRSRWGDDPGATRGVLARLCQALPQAADWPGPLKPGIGLDDNPFIPSGYTYLMQFVAHDLLRTTVPFWQATARGAGSANDRGQGMMLNALYGGGPCASPAAYHQPAGQTNTAGDTTKLRLGRVADAEPASGIATLRDLPRGHAAAQRGNAALTPGHAGCPAAQAMHAADPRNDDNPILAQLTVLFSLAHNIIASNVEPVRPEARFAYARAVMLSIYHSIIRCDLLPRLLHPAVWRAMNERSAAAEDWLWQHPEIPLEFSHGAFRIGHAMVRPSYVLNDRLPRLDIAQLLGTSGVPRAALPADWVLQWSRFFSLGTAPNYSRRIGPTCSSLDFRDLLPAADPSFPDAVSFRDMLSATSVGMWSVEAMIEAIMERTPDVVPVGWTFANAVRRRSLIAQWLREIRHDGGELTDDDIRHLSNDPPLPLFFLLEAGLDPILRGRCLGVLGSVIVGEVMFRRLAVERGRLEMLRTAARTALPMDLADAVAGIDSMPGLVEFVAKFGGLDGCTELPFI